MGDVHNIFDGGRERPPKPPEPINDDMPLITRVLDLLGEIIDEPILTVNDASSNAPRELELRLAHFQPELAQRAAALLEEAGW